MCLIVVCVRLCMNCDCVYMSGLCVSFIVVRLLCVLSDLCYEFACVNMVFVGESFVCYCIIERLVVVVCVCVRCVCVVYVCLRVFVFKVVCLYARLCGLDVLFYVSMLFWCCVHVCAFVYVVCTIDYQCCVCLCYLCVTVHDC